MRTALWTAARLPEMGKNALASGMAGRPSTASIRSIRTTRIAVEQTPESTVSATPARASRGAALRTRWIESEESRRQHEKAECSDRDAHYVRHGDIRHRSGHFDPGVADGPNASHEKDGWSPRFEPVRWCCVSASREWTITRQKVSVHLRSGCCTRALHLALAHSPISRQILLIHCLR